MTDKIALGTPFEALPDIIYRTCCSPGKSCEPVTLTKQLDTTLHNGEAVKLYCYHRSNDDVYFTSLEVDRLIEQMNEEDRWPEAWEHWHPGVDWRD